MTTDFASVATVFGSLGAGAIAVGAAAAWIAKKLRRFNTRFDNFMEDWNGTEARPGVSRKPGVMERLSQQDDALKCIDSRVQAVESEINPNGGKSMRDIVHRVDGTLKHVKTAVDDVSNRVTALESSRGTE